MRTLANNQQFSVISPYKLSFNPYKNTYLYQAKTSRDVSDKDAQTTVYFDATTGKLLASYIPSHIAAGDTVNNWLMNLHKAEVFGLPFQIFICCMGLIIAMLSSTGVYIWLKKRAAR